MEIRNNSKTGPLVPSLAEIPAKLSQQLEAVKQQWLDQLNRDPASFARIEVEIHDHFRNLADQLTAGLLADIVRAVPQEGPNQSLAHHDGAQILARCSADSDNPAIAVAVLLLADDRLLRGQCLQPGRDEPAAGQPSTHV